MEEELMMNKSFPNGAYSNKQKSVNVGLQRLLDTGPISGDLNTIMNPI